MVSLLKEVIAKRTAQIRRGEVPTATIKEELKAVVKRRQVAAPPKPGEPGFVGPIFIPPEERPPPVVKAAIVGARVGVEAAITGPPPKTKFTIPEYQTRVGRIITTGERQIAESLKAEREWKAGIIPTEKYRAPIIGGKYVSPEELKAYLATKPAGWIPQYQIFTGAELRKKGRIEYETYRKDISTQLAKTRKHLAKTYEWHPETTITLRPTTKAYEVQFPYAGAERYRYYKGALERGGIFGLFATALTPEDPLGIVSAFYTSTGETQKALDVKLRALHRVTTIKSPLEFGKYWLESPLTQIGLVTAAAPLVTKGIAYTGGVAFAKWGARGALTVKGIAAVGGGALVTKEVFDIKTEFEIGKPGEAFGRLGVLGFSLAGAYAGYKTVSPKVKAGLFEAGQIRVLSKQLPFIKKGALTKFQWGMPGERIATISRYQEYSVRGVPIERTKYGLIEITAWKPPGKYLRISFPERLDKMTMGKVLFAPTRWVIPQKQLYISFPGAKGLEVGPTLRGLGLATGKIRGITVSDIGVKPLVRGKEFSLFKALSPKIRGKIYTTKFGEFVDIKMLTIKEAYGYGGVPQTFQKTIPKAIFKPEISDIPIFVRGEISPTIFAPFFVPTYKREPIFAAEFTFKEISPILKVGITPIQIPFKAIFPIKVPFAVQEPRFELIQEVSLAQMQTQMQKQLEKSLTKQLYKPPPPPIRKKPPVFVEEPIISGIPFISPPIDIAGRGRRYYGEDIYGKKYKFRKGEIWNPLKDLGFKTKRRKTYGKKKKKRKK